MLMMLRYREIKLMICCSTSLLPKRIPVETAKNEVRDGCVASEY